MGGMLMLIQQPAVQPASRHQPMRQICLGADSYRLCNPGGVRQVLQQPGRLIGSVFRCRTIHARFSLNWIRLTEEMLHCNNTNGDCQIWA